MLPQVVVLVAAGPFISPFVRKVGLDRAAWLSTVAVVSGLAVYALLSGFGYGWVAIALVLVSGGMRVVRPHPARRARPGSRAGRRRNSCPALTPRHGTPDRRRAGKPGPRIRTSPGSVGSLHAAPGRVASG